MAIDAALPLPNISDGYTSVTPDLDAIEFGESMPSYGVRQLAPPLDTMQPAAPQNISVD